MLMTQTVHLAPLFVHSTFLPAFTVCVLPNGGTYKNRAPIMCWHSPQFS